MKGLGITLLHHWALDSTPAILDHKLLFELPSLSKAVLPYTVTLCLLLKTKRDSLIQCVHFLNVKNQCFLKRGTNEVLSDDHNFNIHSPLLGFGHSFDAPVDQLDGLVLPFQNCAYLLEVISSKDQSCGLMVLLPLFSGPWIQYKDSQFPTLMKYVTCTPSAGT